MAIRRKLTPHRGYAIGTAVVVLPTTLQADESNGGDKVITFQRIIVYPDGRKYIEGKTPKQLPAPDASHTLPNSDSSEEKLNDINESEA